MTTTVLPCSSRAGPGPWCPLHCRALSSPLATGILDRFQQRALAGRAAGAGVAGEVGVAEGEATLGEAGTELGHVDDLGYASVSL
jgi:hypothetical protein